MGKKGFHDCAICNWRIVKIIHGSSSFVFYSVIELFNFNLWVMSYHCHFFSCGYVADVGETDLSLFILCDVKMVNFFVILSTFPIWQSPNGVQMIFLYQLFSYKHVCWENMHTFKWNRGICCPRNHFNMSCMINCPKYKCKYFLCLSGFLFESVLSPFPL